MAKKKIIVKLSELRRIAALQCTIAEAAGYFGLSTKAFNRLLANSDKAMKVWEQGQMKGKVGIRRKQHNLAAFNPTMAIHLGKMHLDQHDTQKVELTGKNGKPLIPEQRLDLSHLDAEQRQQLRELLFNKAGPSKS